MFHLSVVKTLLMLEHLRLPKLVSLWELLVKLLRKILILLSWTMNSNQFITLLCGEELSMKTLESLSNSNSPWISVYWSLYLFLLAPLENHHSKLSNYCGWTSSWTSLPQLPFAPSHSLKGLMKTSQLCKELAEKKNWLSQSCGEMFYHKPCGRLLSWSSLCSLDNACSLKKNSTSLLSHTTLKEPK